MSHNINFPGFPDGFGNVYTIHLNHGNYSPADGEHFYGWRWSLAPESLPIYNNRAIIPMNSVIRSVYSSYRIANTPSLEEVEFYFYIHDKNGVQYNKVYLGSFPLRISSGAQGGGYLPNQDIHVKEGDQLIISYKCTWATNPTNLLMTNVIFLEREV